MDVVVPFEVQTVYTRLEILLFSVPQTENKGFSQTSTKQMCSKKCLFRYTMEFLKGIPPIALIFFKRPHSVN